MKVAFISNTAWSLYNFRIGILESLNKISGVEVIAIAPNDAYSKKIASKGIQFYGWNWGVNNTGLINLASAFLKLWYLLMRNKPDVIFAYTVIPIFLVAPIAWLLRIKMVAVVTGAGIGISSKGGMYWLYVHGYKLMKHLVDEIWFINKDDQAEFLALNMTYKEKTKLLPSEGINTNYFDYRPKIKSKRTFTFLFAGRLIWSKGVGLLVEAIKRLKDSNIDVRLQLLGFLDNTNTEKSIDPSIVRQWVEEEWIEYLGMTDDVRPFIEQCDCLVLPSYYREGVPRSLLEALSMGRPIITTDNVGCREVVLNNINGYLVPKHDVDALSKAMLKIINLPLSEYRLMGLNGRNLVETKFSADLVNTFYLEYLGLNPFAINKMKKRSASLQ